MLTQVHHSSVLCERAICVSAVPLFCLNMHTDRHALKLPARHHHPRCQQCITAGAKGTTAGHGAAPVALQQCPFGEGVLPEGVSLSSKARPEAAARLRERCKAMLQIHMQHSSPAEAAAGRQSHDSSAATTDRWAMKCSRRAELQGVVAQLQEALKEHCTKVHNLIIASIASPWYLPLQALQSLIEPI